MSSITAALLVLVFSFGGALLGVYIRRLLPDTHFSSDSKDVVKLGMGLVATTVALVLGLLIASAKGFYDTQVSEVTQMASNLVMLDRLLSHYGPETSETRSILRATAVKQVALLWSHDESTSADIDLGTHGGDVVLDQLELLSPKDERQRSLQAQAISVGIQLGQTRLLVLEQRRVPVPRALLATLIFWLFALFVSFGLFAPFNVTAMSSLLTSAAAVSGAIFLILEFYHPYSGLIQISDAPIRAALAVLGK
jgi:hypothetical protein